MELRQFLVKLPEDVDYDSRKMAEMRRALRAALFSSATAGGKYMSWLFDNPGAAEELHAEPTNWLARSDIGHTHTGRPCVRKLRQGEPTYRCVTCGLDDTCVLCKFCYNPADHEGHEVFVKITHRDDGGICDCGDNEAWKRQLHCLADLQQAPTYEELPQEFSAALFRTFETVLDYTLDVLASADPTVQFMDQEVQVLQNVRDSVLSTSVYGAEDIPSDHRYGLTMWNDDRHSFLDATMAIQLTTSRTPDFGLMVAKRVDSYGKALVSISSDLSSLMQQKQTMKLFTTTVRSVKDLIREEMCDEIIHWLYRLSQATVRGTKPTVLRELIGQALVNPWHVGNKAIINRTPPADNVQFPNPIWSHTLLYGGQIPHPGWIPEDVEVTTPVPDSDDSLIRASARGPLEELPLLARESLPVSEEPRAQTLEQSPVWQRDAAICDAQDRELWDEEQRNGTSRVKMLIFFDIRLWKSLRVTLSDLYVSTLISNLELKPTLGRLYADVYPLLAELYVSIDREPEVSVISALSTQLFTTPSIATELMSGRYFTKFLAAMHTLFTKQRVLPPSSVSALRVFNPSSPILRNRRLGQLFPELVFLLSRNVNKMAIVASSDRLLQVADFLSLFQGLAPMRRQIDKHIEFENDVWVFLFTTIPFVLQLANAVAAGVHECPFGEVRQGIAGVATFLTRWSYLNILKQQGEPVGARTLRRVITGFEYEGELVPKYFPDFRGDRDFVSLHHPVHVFLSFLLENAHIPDVQSLRNTIFSGNQDLFSQFGTECVESLLFENVIQSLAVLSQIHVGLWVRNGYSVRSQLHHYRESTLRELAYMRDLFTVQVALVAMDTNAIVLLLLQRWNMFDWSNGDLFDETQSYYMLEEFLHLLNVLLVDRIYLLGMNEQQVKEAYFKREIVHCLFFRDMSFSEMGQHIPESMTGEDLFEPVLRDCTNFTPPKGVRDVGTYSLKESLKSSFDSHYTHFSSARIEEAEGAASTWFSKKNNVGTDDFVHLPELQQLKGPWGDLGSFTRSAAFSKFMFDLFNTLVNQKLSEHRVHVETVLNKALQLLLRAAQDDLTRDLSLQTTCWGVYPSLSAWLCGREFGGKTLADLIKQILSSPQMAALHSRCRKLIELLQQQDPHRTHSLFEDFEVTMDSQERDTDKKKRHGKAIQAKILEDFKNQRELFAQNAHEFATGDSADEQGSEGDMQEEDTELGWSFPKSQCVLCHMPDSDKSILGLMTYTSNVRIMRQLDENSEPQWLGAGYASTVSSLDVKVEHWPGDIRGNSSWNKFWAERSAESFGDAFPMKQTLETPIVTGCGHAIHYHCYQDFMKNQITRSQQLTRMSPENSGRGEYLCPLCRGLNNGFMPVMWKRNCIPASTFLEPPLTPKQDMELLNRVLQGDGPKGDINWLVIAGMDMLLPKFYASVMDDLPPEAQEANVVTAILTQMVRINEASAHRKRRTENELWGLYINVRTLEATVEALEISLRGVPHASPFGGIVVDQIPPKSLQLIRVFASYIRTLIAFVSHGCLKFDTLGEKGFAEILKVSGHLDPFCRLLELLVLVGPYYGIKPLTILKAMYVASILQFFQHVGRFKYAVVGLPVGEEPKDGVAEIVAKYVPGVDPRMVYGMLARHVTVFLRKAAILVFALCGAYDADDFACIMDKPEHDRLSLYLGLPSLDETLLLMADPRTDFGSCTQQDLSVERIRPPLEYPGVYRLIKLPERLDTFFNLPNQDVFTSDPAVCLFCGETVPVQYAMLSNSEQGPCTKHVAQCAVNYGIYLLPKRNVILLLTADKKGAFTKAPYLDLHGEPDENMRRGRPHYLQQIRYDALARSLWLEQGLASFVARKLDQTVDYGGWETL